MIPLEQGSVFRRIISRCNLNLSRVSIPLEQGSVFRQRGVITFYENACLNPFGTGQCLPTKRCNR